MTSLLTLPIDFVLHNRYTIKATIGQGGFGITYLAQDEQLDVPVCIKELFIGGSSTRGSNMTVQSQSLGDNFSFADFIDRFLSEAQQLARFKHPNIVRVTDVFQANNTAYMVMEYVDGETLKSKIEQDGALPEMTALALFGQLLDAVEVVHQKGMLHRDIKPDNILVTQDNKVVLIDFGSAREFAEGKTTTQTAMLTPGYAPIEQYSNRAQRGTYTDIYALGATLYYVLTGEKPIPATDRNLETLVPPHSLNKQVSSQLSSAVMMAMAMKPEDRFQGIGDVRQAVSFLQQEQSANDTATKKVKVTTPGATKKVVQDKPKAQTSHNDAINKPVGSKKKQRWLVPMLLGIIAIAAVGWFMGTGDTTSETVTIGNQVWMTENLNVSKFRNGDPIPEAKSAKAWKKAKENKQPAWCYYDNDPANGEKYGKLYNWYAVNDPRGLAPAGWHVPSDAEWTVLIDYLGGAAIAGTKMKSTNGWADNGNGSDNSGFSGLPGGLRSSDGTFDAIGSLGFWWSSTESDTDDAWLRNLLYGNGYVNRGSYSKGLGLSVRCLRD